MTKKKSEDDLIGYEIQVFEISQKTPPSLISGILPRLCCPGETLDSQLNQTFQTYFDPSQDVFETPSPWQTFFKNSFFKISQKPLEISKKMHWIKFVDL